MALINEPIADKVMRSNSCCFQHGGQPPQRAEALCQYYGVIFSLTPKQEMGSAVHSTCIITSVCNYIDIDRGMLLKITSDNVYMYMYIHGIQNYLSFLSQLLSVQYRCIYVSAIYLYVKLHI